MLEECYAGIGIEQVNLIGIDMQWDGAADMRLRTWVESCNRHLASSFYIYLQLAAQVLDNIHSTLDDRAAIGTLGQK